MSEHTKEPWISKPTAGSDGEYCTIISESEGRAVARHVRPADAEYIITLKAQRDELLAAAKIFRSSLHFERNTEQVKQLMIAAIANVEDGGKYEATR